jgi:tetratricopeptide (TPR) repeat protein
MRRHQYVAAVALGAVFVLALAAGAWAQTGRVGGLVKDENGQPIKGATITADNENIGQSFTASTDDKGRFTMIGLRAGLWRFIAQAPGYGPDGGTAPIRMGTPNPPLTFSLKKTGNANFGALGGIAAKDLQTDLSAADALFNQHKWDESIVAYRSISTKAPALLVVNLQIAAAYRNKKDYDAAIAAYNDLLKIDPGNEKAHVGISQTEIERGNNQAAERALQTAAETAGAGREVYYSLAEIKLAKGETDEAVRWYEKAAAADPAWGKPLYKLAQAAVNKGDAGAARRFFGRVLAVDPLSSEAAEAKTALASLNK